MKPFNPVTKCADGVSLSVQASKAHYCIPRNDVGPYSHVEVAFIEDADGNRVTPPEEWREYAGAGEFPRDYYGWVPVGLVDAFVAMHGGAAQEPEAKARRTKMGNEIERLRTELGRAYRALAAYIDANEKGKPLNDATIAYHSLTEAAAKRFVTHGALDGSEYFLDKSVDVLHAALRGE